MAIEDILNSMDEMLDKSWSLPMTGGRSVVDAEKIRDMIDDIRINLPTEIKQAKAIVADRADIIGDAKLESEALIRKAEERSKALIAHEEVVKEAQTRASDILTQAQVKSREIRQAAYNFSDELLRSTEETVTRSLADVRATRQALRDSARQK
ncbi:MAG: ATPase [Oscillospiraceae bacterium]|nr:ATPase [Oscillospiraceae bacterium]